METKTAFQRSLSTACTKVTCQGFISTWHFGSALQVRTEKVGFCQNLTWKDFQQFCFLFPSGKEKKRFTCRNLMKQKIQLLHCIPSWWQRAQVTQSVSGPQQHSHLEEGLLAVPARMLCHFSGCLYLDAVLNVPFWACLKLLPPPSSTNSIFLIQNRPLIFALG